LSWLTARIAAKMTVNAASPQARHPAELREQLDAEHVERHPHDAEGAGRHHHARQHGRERRGRGRMGVGHPAVQRHDRGLDAEAGDEAPEDDEQRAVRSMSSRS
jgi:hypothetical protein